MVIANLCNGSTIQFSDTATFLPGGNVTITCSLPAPQLTMLWASPHFSLVVLSSLLGNTTARLGGAIVFSLENATTGSAQCTTTTATVINIQESLQGLSLTCSDGATILSTLVIDVVGKLHVVCAGLVVH